MVDITRDDLPTLYNEVLWRFKFSDAEVYDSRVGRVKAFKEPFSICITDPQKRMLFNKERNANPFFHIAEVVWMLAGDRKAAWLAQFNKNYANYAEDDGLVWGAYGYRWIAPEDQIQLIINRLKKFPQDRRCVLQMWDKDLDLDVEKRDVPCNTHIYFRIMEGKLDMTVCNRSNDVIWGMLGSNVVLFTILQEIIAHNIGVELGRYYVMTSNAHMYERHWHLTERIMNDDPYGKGLETLPITGKWDELKEDALNLVHGRYSDLNTLWMNHTAKFVILAYLDKENRDEFIRLIKASDIKAACEQWVEWRQNEKERNL